MQDFLLSLDWPTVITTIWTVILLPILTRLAKQLNDWSELKKADKNTTALQESVASSVKDVYQTIVNDIKGTEEWTTEKQQEVKELAKTKVVASLSNSAYKSLKAANEDFDDYLGTLIESSLFDMKSENSKNKVETMM